MIKERHFKVHPNVLTCLLQLRLRTELGVRASSTHADKPEANKGKKLKGKKPEPVHLSKKAKKALKEQKEIDKELREAGAEVDKEERKTVVSYLILLLSFFLSEAIAQIQQTETLKLLFALYFRILKNPVPTALLPSALSGISKFAHLVNIDFFKDLMKVLKDLISIEEAEEEDASEEGDRISRGPLPTFQGVLRKLMCIVTAFELLSGQGVCVSDASATC
jgi:nucleolar complex protein 3